MVTDASSARRSVDSLVELLGRRALAQPDVVAYTFLHGDRESTYTYAELDRRARLVAAALRDRCAAGDRVLLLLPPGLGYVAAFFGCLYAGAVAVPVYPPDGPGTARSLSRLEAIVADAEPTAAVTLAENGDHLAELARTRPLLARTSWIFVDRPEVAGDPALEPARVGPDDLAFLQYTSGSTATPKGVMVSHGNLLSNGADIERAFGFGPSSKMVTWLPPYHDMGLIGGILQALYSGYPSVLMSPADFATRPLRWLQAIGDHRATASGGPNFAYELCVRKIDPAQLDGLDLSNWSVAFNGAEPIRAEVMDRFADLLEPTGFRQSAFYPCYGLAEATLFVTGGDPAADPVVRRGEGAPLVGCGRPSPDQRLAIVDPETRTECPDRTVGEIWVAGPSVAQGYWGRSDETAETFAARLAVTTAAPFLRTGDLGFLDDGELFVTGRIKDLIIQRGVNYYPQDIEHTAIGSHPALRPGGGAAFALPVDGEERLVVANELDRRHRDADPAEVIDAVRRAVVEEHAVAPYAVVLVPPGRLPRTSSGKIQRHAARDRYARGELESVGGRVFAPDRSAPVGEPVTRILRREIAARTGVDADEVDLSLTGPALGLDSMALLEIQHALETRFGVELSPPGLHGDSVAAIAERATATGTTVARLRSGTPARSSNPNPAGPEPGSRSTGATAETRHRPSAGQRGLWFLDRMTACGPAYNLAGALRLPRSLDAGALERALRVVLERNEALRNTFAPVDGEVVRRVEPVPAVVLESRTLPEDTGALERELADVAGQPLDLERGPLLRTLLWTAPGRRPVLLLVIHHIVGDFWSLTLLLEEIAERYQADVTGRTPPARSADDYADFVAWQAGYLDSAAGRIDEAYWRQRLGGDLPILDLPTSRPRPPVQGFRGAAHAFRLDDELTGRLRELARECSTTLYTLLLCAFEVLLHRYTGQTDILVGSPTSGRTRSAFGGTVGYLVNPVVIRGDLRGDPSFRALLGHFRELVAEALTHQDYPFARLAEVLQPARDPSHSPIFQAMFVYHRAPSDLSSALGLLAIGQTGGAFEVSGLRCEPVPLPTRTAQFDLTLATAEDGDALAGAFQYDSDLFDAGTVAGLADAFVALLHGLARDPDRPIGGLPLLDSATSGRLLAGLNDTASPFPADRCVHEAFEAAVAGRPEAVAVVCGTETVTYRELDERADRVAARLADLGAGPDVLVGLCVDRSPEMLAGLLGVLKAGAAYVPLDPEYPGDRLAAVVADSGIRLLATRTHLIDRVPRTGMAVVDIDAAERAEAGSGCPPRGAGMDSGHAAYVLYTSGSTGTPKGVVVSHRNVANFFAGMDERVGCGPGDTLLAVTSVAFDISVLELLWTLTRGARVVVTQDRLTAPVKGTPLDFSLFYFASANAAPGTDRYRLVLDGARFADRHGFTAVWTPERHFHEFGGLYPNPSVLSAALATITDNVALRGGSVVLPLHSPVRVAEEWALVDNLSGGRVGVAFASGWHADDFVFFPEHYADRRERTVRGIATVRALWRGETVTARGGSGNPLDIRIFPAPVQPELPTWVTAAGSPETFRRAGAIGANVLTHLLGQTVRQVTANIRRYREARAEHGHDPDAGTVTLMLHTFVGDDLDEVRERVRRPFVEYLRTSVGLVENLVRSLDLPLDLGAMSESDMADLLDFAADRYFETSALIGTPHSVQPLIETLAAVGVNEVACLIDFGLPDDVVLDHLPKLDTVRRRNATAPPEEGGAGRSPATLIEEHRPTLLQATPSMMRLLSADPRSTEGLRSLRALLVGGEALPPALARSVRAALPATLLNMYGPTETTIWSSTHEVRAADEDTVPLGEPIANTQVYVVDPRLEPMPVGVPGELLIGGAGVSRGYWRRPGLTAESFVPDPFGATPGGRLYRTGDRVRRRPDGTLEFLGRLDRQLKVRGMRVEPGDVEAALCRRPEVREAVVVPRGEAPDDLRLVAYVVPEPGAAPAAGELRRAMRAELPEAMIPSRFVPLSRLPLTVNGKVDISALPERGQPDPGSAVQTPPATDLERRIAAVWSEVLGTDSVGLYDNFFDLGGHSLLMVQVHGRLRPLVGELPLIRLLEHPTVSSLASYLGENGPSPASFEATRERARRQRASRRTRRAPDERSPA